MKKLFIASVLLLSISSFAQKTIIITNNATGHTLQVTRIASVDATAASSYFTGDFSPTLSLTAGSSYTMGPFGGNMFKFPFNYLVFVGSPNIPTWIKTASSFPVTSLTKVNAFADALATSQVFDYAIVGVDGGTLTVFAAGTYTIGSTTLIIDHPLANPAATNITLN